MIAVFMYPSKLVSKFAPRFNPNCSASRISGPNFNGSETQLVISPELGASRRRRTLPQIRHRAMEICDGAEATSTRTQRNRLWNRFTDWRTSHNLPQGDEAMIMFIVSTDVKARSGLTYLTNLKSRAYPKDLLESFSRGLRRQAASEPVQGALPASRETMFQAMLLAPLEPRMFLYLAWRTASRFDEVSNLTAANFLQTSPNVVIWWKNASKTSQLEPEQARFFTVVTPPHPTLHDPFWTAATRFFCAFQGWSPETREQARMWMNSVDRQLTDHSCKVGALDRLLGLSATGQVPLQAVSMLAKHKGAEAGFLSNTTTGYARNHLQLALALNTKEATLWL